MPGPAEKPRLKITDVKSVPVRLVREVGYLEPAWAPGSKNLTTIGGGSFVEIHTDQGLVGIGPAVAPQFLPRIKELLLDKDPFDIEKHVHMMRHFVLGTPYSGSAGIDIALWDLIGKACEQPLYKLWGGGKHRVIPYASMVLLSTPEERADMATKLADEGWKAIKLRLHHETIAEDLRTMETVRNAVGDRMTIMVDGNQAQSSGTWQPGVRWDFRRAMDTARELEKMDCFWLEEPLPRHQFDRIAEMCSKLEMPIAGGENNRGIHEFVQMVTQGVYDVLQPESMVLDGITALRKIGVLAETFGKQIVPHHGGRNLGLIAHLHLVASWPHAPFLEVLHDPPVGDYHHPFAMLADPPEVDAEGFMTVPQGPGLGVEINPEMIDR